MAMEPKERMLLEGVLGAVLITFLVLASIMIVSAYNKPDAAITNSYNTNSYNTNSFNAYPSQAARPAYIKTRQYVTSYPSRTYSKPYIVDRTGYSRYHYKDYPAYKYYYTKDDSRYRYYHVRDKPYSDERYLRYDDSGNFRSYAGIVGNRVDSYEIYIRNREYTGGYFKTTFYFEDYYGKVDSQSTTYYVPAREEKAFAFRDVSPPRYKYRTWWYDVSPLTKVPAKTYYNDDTPYKVVYSDSSQPGTYSGGYKPRTYSGVSQQRTYSYSY